MAKRSKRPHEPEIGKRLPIGLRVTPQMRVAIEDSARNSGRSLSQEVEFRIEQSFSSAGQLEQAVALLYGPNLGGLLKTLGDALRGAGQMAQVTWFLDNRGKAYRDWTQIPEVYDLVTGIGRELIDAARPPEDATEDSFLHVDGVALRDFITERMQEHFDQQAAARAGHRRTPKSMAPVLLRKVYRWKPRQAIPSPKV